MIKLREVIEKSKEKEESDNLAVKALFHIINNLVYGIYIILMVCVVMGGFATALGVFMGIPFLSITFFENEHMIAGGVTALISLTIWGAAFRLT